jgi:hypothetical protein
VTSNLTYNAALSTLAPLVNGQPQIILTDRIVTIAITNNLGTGISSSVVSDNKQQFQNCRIDLGAGHLTIRNGMVLINSLNFTNLDNFDWNQ